MTRLLAACLLLLACLLPRPATSQVWQLDSGTVVRERLIGLDTSTYGRTRRYVAGAGALLGVRALRLAEAARVHQLDSLRLAATADELRRCRMGAAASEAEFQKLASLARTAAALPTGRPLLLDANTYKGGLLGAAALLLLKLFVLH